MKANKNSEYQFKYLTFKELEHIEKSNPIAYKAFSRSSCVRIKTCPDVTSNFPCFFYVINKENKIVCLNKALPDTLCMGTEKRQWAWTGNTFTEEAYRKKGLAKMLMQESTKVLHKEGIGRGIVFSNNVTLRIYRKLGYCLAGYASRYLMIKCARPFLEAHIKSKLIIHILDLLSLPIIRLIFQFYYGKRKLDILDAETIKFQLIDKNKLNKFMSEIDYKKKFHFNDSLAKLIWKINVSNENSENKCSLYILKETKNLDPIAYFVIRMKHQLEPIGVRYKDFDIMTLMDYGLFKNDKRIYPTILKEVTKMFWKSEAEVFEVISNSELFASVMRRLGMVKVGKGMSFTFSVPDNWDLGKDCTELHNWSLTHFCGDGFSF